MILTCPQCATRFQADAAKFLPAGRTVKCAKCGEVWHQGAPPQETEPGTVSVESEPRHDEPVLNEKSTRTRPDPPAAGAHLVAGEPSRAARHAQRAAQVVGWVALAFILFLI